MLTSLLPQHHSASVPEQLRVSPTVPTLAEVLREAGYATASFNGGIQLDPSFGLDRGFDVYESARSRGDAAETLQGEETRMRSAVARSLEWLDAVGDRPFFLFLHSYEVHHPYTPDPAWRERFDAGYEGSLPDSISVELLMRMNRDRRRIPPADLAHIIATYDAELRQVDHALAALLDHLHETGRYDDTMIVVVSDHGEEFGERGFLGWHSHTLFDELLLVPGFVKYPGSRDAGRALSRTVRGIDLAPTILAALDLPAPSTFDGRDAGALLRRDGAELPTLARRDKQANADSLGLRTDRWKLANEHLFDLERDPYERVNLAPQRPDLVDSLSALHEEIVARRDPSPTVSTETSPELLEQLRALGYVD